MTRRRRFVLAVACLLAVGAGFAAATAGGPTRSAPGTVATNGTATVTVAVDTGSGGAFSYSEAFSGQVADATIQNVTVDGQPASTLIEEASENGTVVTLSSSPPNATLEVTYTVEAADTTGWINITSQSGGPTTSIQVVARQSITSLSRQVPASVNASENATVTVTATTGAAGGVVSLTETFAGPVADATVRSVTVDGNATGTLVSDATRNGTTVTVPGVPANATVEVTYAIEAAARAGNVTVEGNVTGSRTLDLGTDIIAVVQPCGLSSLVASYDTTGDCAIDVGELGDAAADYARGRIDIGELGRVAAAYAST